MAEATDNQPHEEPVISVENQLNEDVQVPAEMVINDQQPLEAVELEIPAQVDDEENGGASFVGVPPPRVQVFTCEKVLT